MNQLNEVREASAEYLAAGELVPVGYKKTEVGIIPEDWDVRSIGDICDLLTGFPFPSAQYADSGIRLLRGSNVKRGEIDWDDGLVQYWSKITSSIKQYELAVGDIVISMDGSLVGRSFSQISLDDLPALLLQRVARLRSDTVVIDFLKEWICSKFFTAHCDAVKTVTAIPHISPTDIRTFSIAVPRHKKEQTAIANALSDADALITSLEKLIAKKQAIKTATMQQLLTGKTRLPQFALRADGTPKGTKHSELGEIPEDWEVVQFSSVLKIRHGRNQKEVEAIDGAFPIFASGGEIGRSTEPLYRKPSVLIGRKGTIDKPRFADSPFWTVDTLFYSEIFTGAEPKFIFYKFCMINWMDYNEASGVPSLNASTIESVQIAFPNKEEQISIAVVISSMDTEIRTLQQRLDKTRQVKQGMMQELLTGKTRLVKLGKAVSQ